MTATIACPGCRAQYAVDARVDPNAPFVCPNCGTDAPVGTLLAAAGVAVAMPQAPPPPQAPPQQQASMPSMDWGAPKAPPPKATPQQQAMKKTSQRQARPPEAAGLDLADEPEAPAPAPPPKKVSQRHAAQPPPPKAGGLDLTEEEPEEPEAPAPPPKRTSQRLAASKKTSQRQAALPAPGEEGEATDEAPKAAGGPPWVLIRIAVAIGVACAGYAYVTRDPPPPSPRPPVARATEAPPEPPPTEEQAAAPDTERLRKEQEETGDLWLQANEAMAREEWQVAADLVAKIPRAAQVRNAGAIAQLKVRCQEMLAFEAKATVALAEAKRLLEAGDLGGARARLDAVLPSGGSVPGTRIGREVLAARAATEMVHRATGRPRAVRAEPPERTAAAEKAAAAGAERLAALRKRLAEEKGVAAALQAAGLEAARSATAKKPLGKLEVVPGLVLDAAVIEALDDERFSLRAAGGDEVAFSWDAVKPDVALRLRRLAIREDQAADHLRYAVWCLSRRQFAEARRASKKAAQLDPSLAGRLPDVDLCERAAKVFQGKLERRGNTLEVRYQFDDPEQAKDWTSFTGNAVHGVQEGRLIVQGEGVFLLGSPALGFTGTVDIQGNVDAISDSNVGAAVGVCFDPGTERAVTYVAILFQTTGELAFARWKGEGGLEVLERRRDAGRGKNARVRILVRDGRVEVQTRSKTQCSARLEGTWESVKVLVGGAGEGAGALAHTDVVMRGKARFAWLRKTWGEFEAALATVLAFTDSLPIHARPKEPPPPAPLSAEDAWALEGIPDEAVAEYRRAVAALAAASAQDPEPLVRGFDQLNQVIQDHPHFAAASYARAKLAMALGQPGLALEDLERATLHCPGFHEALALRAIALAGLGQLEEARKVAEEARRLRPDGAAAWEAAGELAFEAGDLPRALEAFELALALDPSNDSVRGRRRNVNHVIHGPPWTRRFTAETTHYIVESNIAQKRTEEYARDLELARKVYAERFGVPAALPAGAAKSRVLVFDTEEGYHGHAMLTIDDREDSTLGLYMPRYRQLMLFEDKLDPTLRETKQTLLHEGFHQFLHQLLPDVAVPFWLNEGLAEFASAVKIEGDRITAQGLVLQGRLANLRTFIAGGGPFPFPQLMKETPDEFYSGLVWAKYAQAWAMVHFFELGPDEGLRAKYRKYVGLIREGKTSEEAHDLAWAGTDWEAAVEKFKVHVAGLK